MDPAPPQATLTVLGSGTLLPDAARSSACFHLDVPAGNGSSRGVLLDCGSGTLHGLARHGVDWRAIDVIALTHYHTDHVGDLAALLGAFRYVGRSRPMTMLGPGDLRSYLSRLAAVAGRWVTDPGFALDVVALGARAGGADAVWSDPDGSLAIGSCRTPHTDVSRALRVQGAWGRVGYTGDTGPSAEVTEFLSGCDVLVAECALSDPPAMETHLAPSTLAAMARRARPDLLVVTHVCPPRAGDETAEEIRAAWHGRVVAAYDGMRVRVSAEGATVDHAAGGP